ncbi:MAG: glucose-6-phosphate isomerase [Anaerolineaceae bacterium]|nr:glucose-6-phosphate isomerase [Anaerolineaceae bacterium]
MPNYMSPFTTMINLSNGLIPIAAVVQKRYLHDLEGMFADSTAEDALMINNPLLYEVQEATQNPMEEGQLRYSTTTIYPGKVGDEYYFTKGHYHAIGSRAELYMGLAGEGYLLLMSPENEINVQRMTPGAMSYIPPYWAHRTINIGKDNFVFFACYPADAGYDYASIADKGFAQIVVERGGKPTLIENPKWEK